MIPILYDKTGLNKFGELHDIIIDGDSCVEEERNGLFELSFDYPNGYPLSNQLIEENIIEVKPNDIQGLQKFRIYDTKCLMKDIITVLARHESFDLANDHIENINLENASCEYALNTLFRNSHFSRHYKGYSDIINAQNYSIDNINILNAIAGKEGSIIDTYGTGAEILRDGTNIHVLNKRGHDNDVIIEFGKNLTDFVLERDLTNLETRAGGFVKYTPEGGKETIVKSNWIDSPYINNFSHPYISIEGRRDYSDKFKDGEIPTVEKLNKLCVDEFLINKRDIPKSNYTIKFIPLSKCVGYEGIQDKISLCDTVRIIDKRFNIDTKAKVIKYKYNFIKEQYESMELGEPRTTLGDIITSSDGKDGNDGKNGKDGVNGKDGNDGKNGVDGIPGRPGIDGKIYYTWIKYADDSLGNGMSNISTGKEYIGLAYNKEISTESDNPKEYTWSKFRGDQGIPGKAGLDGTPGINGKDGKTYYTWIKYADDNIGSGMSDSPTGKDYIGISYNNLSNIESPNSKDYAWSLIKGEDGRPGKNGQDGVTYYTWIKYADNNIGSGMSDNPLNKVYIGVAYNKTESVESTNPKDYAWSLIKGEDGRPGINGKDGKIYYTWIKYSKNGDGSNMQDSPEGMIYIGIAYNKETSIESTNPKDYAWSLIKGQDGVTYYTWIKYANDNLGNGMSDNSTNKEYIGIAYNKPDPQESTNSKDYIWTKIKGDKGLPGAPGVDGKTYYTWIKYANDALGSGITDDPTGKAYLGLAFNKPVAQESTNPKDYTWSKIKGEDGKVDNMPDTLPNTPVLESKVYGMGSVELNWTFENKLYYNYELYASKQKDFKPNSFDLIHAGQSSSFLFNAKPSETWYFKVCAVNSHQRRTPFSNQVEAKLPKVEDMNNYFSEMAIGKAVAQSITADYIKAGIIKGNWIDAKHLSVTDGNGKRTLDIDSFGRITLMPTNFKMIVNDKEEDVITQTSFEATKKDFTFKFKNTGSENLIKNSWFKSSSSYWSFEHWMCGDNSPERSDIGVTTGNMNDGWVPLGQQVGRIINYGGNNQANKHWHGFGQYVNVEPNTNYTLSFYGAQHRINEVVIEIKKADSKKHIPIGGSMTLDASKIKGSAQQGSSFENDFTLIKHTFQVPADCYQIQILIWSAGRPASNASYLWIGRVQLEKGLEATSRRLNSNEIYNDITTVDGEGIKVTHSNGDYTRMSSQGLKRHRSNGEEKGDYHYLTQYIGFTTTGNTEDLNWIQLKDDFKGKRFTAYSVMSDTWQDSWDWGKPWVIQRFVTFVQEDKIDYANARVPVKGYRVDKNYTTGERRIKPVGGILLVIA